MKTSYLLPLILLISFASICAVAFTPGLPELLKYFAVTTEQGNLTITLFLLSYALGQLLYGPLANRYGSKKAIIIGVTLEIIGSLACVIAIKLHHFELLLLARVIMALGAACGLKMTFTLSTKLFSQNENAKVMSLLTASFAITPSLGVFIGGILVSHFDVTYPLSL